LSIATNLCFLTKPFERGVSLVAESTIRICNDNHSSGNHSNERLFIFSDQRQYLESLNDIKKRLTNLFDN